MIYNDHIVLHIYVYMHIYIYIHGLSRRQLSFPELVCQYSLHHSVLSCTYSSAKAILSLQDGDETYSLISLATAILHHLLGDQMAWSAGDRPYSYP